MKKFLKIFKDEQDPTVVIFEFLVIFKIFDIDRGDDEQKIFSKSEKFKNFFKNFFVKDQRQRIPKTVGQESAEKGDFQINR